MARKGTYLHDDDIEIFRKSVGSQYKSDLYERLKKEGRLDRFIDVLSLCGQRNMNLSETCRVLTKYFPSYCKQGKTKGLNPKTLSTLIKFYPDIEEAWTFNKELSMMSSFINASRIAGTTNDMDVVLKFHEAFDDTDLGLYRRKDEDSSGGKSDGVTQVNIYNSRPEDDEEE